MVLTWRPNEGLVWTSWEVHAATDKFIIRLSEAQGFKINHSTKKTIIFKNFNLKVRRGEISKSLDLFVLSKRRAETLSLKSNYDELEG